MMKMKSVFIVQHSYNLEGCDETKIIGIYSNEKEAKLAIDRIKLQPGFSQKPNDFYVDEYELNKDNWAEGYITQRN